MERPIVLEIDEAKKELVQVVNDIIKRGIPFTVIDLMMSEIVTQIKSAMAEELKMATEQVKAEEASDNGEA